MWLQLLQKQLDLLLKASNHPRLSQPPHTSKLRKHRRRRMLRISRFELHLPQPHCRINLQLPQLGDGIKGILTILHGVSKSDTCFPSLGEQGSSCYHNLSMGVHFPNVIDLPYQVKTSHRSPNQQKIANAQFRADSVTQERLSKNLCRQHNHLFNTLAGSSYDITRLSR
jgi:hypothetical protein